MFNFTTDSHKCAFSLRSEHLAKTKYIRNSFFLLGLVKNHLRLYWPFKALSGDSMNEQTQQRDGFL
jgi:hypothetical protein